MIQGSFPINFGNPLLDDIQDMVQAFLYKDEHGQAMPQFDLANIENGFVSRGVSNQIHLQPDEISIWEYIQEKQNKIAAWKSRFHEVKEACDQRGISLNGSRESALGVKLADIMATRTSDFRLVDGLDGIEEKGFYENAQVGLRMQNICKSSEMLTSDDHLNLFDSNSNAIDDIRRDSDEFQALMQKQRLISQQTDQALLKAEQQCQEWGLLSREVGSLNQEVQNLQNAVACSLQNTNVLERTVASHCE